MRKPLLLALLAAASTLASLPAHAGGHVQWSVGINAPIGYGGTVATVVSNGPVYAAAPVYYAPAPVVYAPPPVVVSSPVVYAPAAPVVYGPPVWAPAYGWRHRHHHHHHD